MASPGNDTPNLPNFHEKLINQFINDGSWQGRPSLLVFVGSTGPLGHQKYSGETTSFPQQLKITKEYNWNDGTVRKPPKGTEFGKTGLT